MKNGEKINTELLVFSEAEFKKLDRVAFCSKFSSCLLLFQHI